MDRWVAVVARDGAEIALAECLAESGIAAYCPRYIRWRKLPKHIARREGKARELITDALLTGYIFAQASSAEQLAAIHGHRDVFGIVSTSAGVCYARGQDIEELKAIERSGAHNAKPAPPKERLKEYSAIKAQPSKDAMLAKLSNMKLSTLDGKTVAIISGLFSGTTGVVQSTTGDSAVVQIGSVKVAMPACALQPTA